MCKAKISAFPERVSVGLNTCQREIKFAGGVRSQQSLILSHFLRLSHVLDQKQMGSYNWEESIR